jgi:hypothetical protein
MIRDRFRLFWRGCENWTWGVASRMIGCVRGHVGWMLLDTVVCGSWIDTRAPSSMGKGCIVSELLFDSI